MRGQVLEVGRAPGQRASQPLRHGLAPGPAHLALGTQGHDVMPAGCLLGVVECAYGMERSGGAGWTASASEARGGTSGLRGQSAGRAAASHPHSLGSKRSPTRVFHE